jgi:hypothetical protein
MLYDCNCRQLYTLPLTYFTTYHLPSQGFTETSCLIKGDKPQNGGVRGCHTTRVLCFLVLKLMKHGSLSVCQLVLSRELVKNIANFPPQFTNLRVCPRDGTYTVVINPLPQFVEYLSGVAPTYPKLFRGSLYIY